MKTSRLILFLLSLCYGYSVYAQAEVADEDIKKVYVIFKTHLDVGFTEQGSKVVDTYNHDFIPSVLKLSERALNKDSACLAYPWTTGSWLIWNYLQQALPANRTRMEHAIQRGDFWWHAMPFTIQAELCDSALMSAAFSLSESLDRQFGRKTVAAKITDVPGVTRSIIPILKRHGITLLHLGANPGAAVPRLPEIFRWKDINGESVNVICQSDYGKPLKIPHTTTAAVINFTHDNHGPHSEQEVKLVYEDLAKRYPHAKIIPASLNEIAGEVGKIADSLPVVTQEWGDTWIYGVASDPKKVAEFRQLMRLRNQWIAEKKLMPGSDTDIAFIIPLLLVTEHTWGLDVKTFLKNYDKYEFDKYPAFLESEEAKYIERSWNEKRAYIGQAISVLPANLGREAEMALAQLMPEKPMLDEGKEYIPGKVIDTKFFLVAFDSQTGSINYLKAKSDGKLWADTLHPWGEFAYQIYSGNNFSDFISRYCPKNPEWWMLEDYGKPGLDKLDIHGRIVNYKVKKIVVKEEGQKISVWVSVCSGGEKNIYGAPQEGYIKYSFSVEAPELDVELSWFGKRKNRIPEAIWFSFHPMLVQSKVYVDKLGTKVDVADVVYNGARTIHGIAKNVFFEADDKKLTIESLDAPLVAFNERNLLCFDNKQADPQQGVHFCLLNTLWGTNYPQWFGDDMKFRFSIYLK